MQDKLSFIKDHECKSLEKQKDISVTQYDHKGIKKWFWSYKSQLHQIAYCPYCGKKLEVDT